MHTHARTHTHTRSNNVAEVVDRALTTEGTKRRTGRRQGWRCWRTWRACAGGAGNLLLLDGTGGNARSPFLACSRVACLLLLNRRPALEAGCKKPYRSTRVMIGYDWPFVHAQTIGGARLQTAAPKRQPVATPAPVLAGEHPQHPRRATASAKAYSTRKANAGRDKCDARRVWRRSPSAACGTKSCLRPPPSCCAVDVCTDSSRTSTSMKATRKKIYYIYI